DAPIVRIELLRLAERVQRILIIALSLVRLPEAFPRYRLPELGVGPAAAKLGRTPVISGGEHTRPFDLEHRDARVPLGEKLGEIRIDGRAGRGSRRDIGCDALRARAEPRDL